MNKVKYKEHNNVVQSSKHVITLSTGITIGFMIGLCFTLLVRLIFNN